MTTTTIVAHDAHVACRATFIAARTAMVQAAVTKRARAAARAATRAEVRATAKVVRTANVVAKEAAEKHASAVSGHAVRVANRAAHKAYCAPMVRAAKKQAACIAKVVRAMRTAALIAVRAQRAAASATKTIATTVVAIDKAYVQHTMAARATVVCVGTPMHSAHVHAYHATIKAANKAANKVHAAIKAPRCTLNSPEKRASIHDAQVARINARTAIRVKTGTSISLKTIEARLAQGAAQKAANAARKAGMPAKVARPQVVIVRSGPAKNKGAKRVRVHHMAHTVESVAKLASDRANAVAAEAAHKAMLVKFKEDKAILRAKKAAQRKLWIQLRKEKVARICAKAWMEKGLWVDRFLAEACNDACYEIRTSAMTELLALVGVAA